MSTENKNVTLTNIAKTAGVSVSTASRVLNQNDKIIPISPKTKEKVLRVAREMGYMPSMAARALRSGSTKTIGVLGTSPKSFIREGDPSDQHVSFVNEILRGLINSTVDRGYNLTLLTGTEQQNVTEMELLAGFGMVDGMLVLNRDLSADDICANTLHFYPKPLVYALDYQDDDEIITAPDDIQGGLLATRILLERGHQKIAFISAPLFKDIFQRRKAGWESALKEKGLDLKEQLFVPDVSALDIQDIRSAGCTAAVCANVPSAEIFDDLCIRAGINVPGQMEIIGFFHETGSQTGWCPGCRTETVSQANGGNPRSNPPRFANVLSPLATIIANGVHRLIDRIEGRELTEKKKVFPFRLQYGQSCPEK